MLSLDAGNLLSLSRPARSPSNHKSRFTLAGRLAQEWSRARLAILLLRIAEKGNGDANAAIANKHLFRGRLRCRSQAVTRRADG
jgi:hypothetical protein